ncbi:DUF3761 domain-containing protein [Nocardioides sp. B-3]|uniref:DUF3761 domain-containing protein n=1 Tax=Nocardioides sp. B-3 TaxID=2895565 RepID=UPI003FA5E0B3
MSPTPWRRPPTPPAIVQWSPSPDAPYEQGFRPHAVCRDGTVSYSLDNRGTCSWHGGVARWVYNDPGR